MSSEWIRVAVQVVVGVLGGFTGGWAVAWRMGAWRQKIEDRVQTLKARLQKHESRLEEGDETLGKVPVQNAQIHTLISEIQNLREDMKTVRRRYVTQRECDRRHGDGSDEGSDK